MGLTQKDLADRAGVGLRFIRDLEQGKESLRLDKVNQVLALFGHRMEPLEEQDNSYVFSYSPDYLDLTDAAAASLSLPLQSEPFEDKRLFPFFDGLIPEGWLLEIAEHTWKLNPRDRMGLLQACCRDCIGAVSIAPQGESNE
jgi:serine/threonine-protein kinase HipA